MITVLGLMLGMDPPREWRLFTWCIYFPILTIALSWLLIRWKRTMVGIALAVAAVSAGLLVNELRGEIRYRATVKARLESLLRDGETRASTADPEHRAENEAWRKTMQSRISSFDYETFQGIPQISPRIVLAVWSAALFPFVMVIAFYRSGRDPVKTKSGVI